MQLAFVARDVANWLGIPVAVVIVALIALRRWGKGRMAARRARQQGHGPTPPDLR